MKKEPISKLLVLLSSGILISLLSGVFGGPFFRVAFKSYGLKLFWISFFAFTIGIYFTGGASLLVIVSPCWLSIGIYSYLVSRGFRWDQAGWISVISVSIVILGLSAFTIYQLGLLSWDQLLQLTKEKLLIVKSTAQIDFPVDEVAEKGLWLAPGFLIIMYIINLANALIFERAVLNLFGLPHFKFVGDLRLVDFKVGDKTIWFSLLSFFFALIDFHQPALKFLGQNLSLILLTVYFFQGIAVAEVFLVYLRAGAIMRAVTYFLIIGNLFPIFIMLGLIDYWVDFRQRLKRNKASRRH